MRISFEYQLELIYIIKEKNLNLTIFYNDRQLKNRRISEKKREYIGKEQEV